MELGKQMRNVLEHDVSSRVLADILDCRNDGKSEKVWVSVFKKMYQDAGFDSLTRSVKTSCHDKE